MNRPKHSNRVVVYFTDAQYMDVLKSAAKFDKVPGEWVRFEMLRAMHGSMGMSDAALNQNRSAFACADEGDDE